MKNTNQNMDQNKNPKEGAEKLNKKIKETWPSLSDNDVKLYGSDRKEFVSKLENKEKISKEKAEEKLHKLEKECGCSQAKAA